MENTLNLKQLRNLENAIVSLSESTGLHIVTKNETFNFKRLNAIKSSTSFMEYSNIGHNCSGIMLLTNAKHILVITNKNTRDVDINTNMPYLRMKPFLVEKIFDRLPQIIIPSWIFDMSLLINVHFIDRYNGKPNGEPCFDKVNYFYFEGKEVYKDFEMKDLEKQNNDIANGNFIDNLEVL